MRNVDYLIVGGSAAGTTAAEVIRSRNGEGSITIVTDEEEEYSRVLLPFYSRNKIKREQVFLKTPDWYKQKNIELLKKTKATGLNCADHLITLSDGEEIQYGKLLISIGGRVIRLDAAGSQLENILYFRTLEDTDKVIKAASSAKAGVIVGGGLISLDFATCFKANNVGEVTILVKEPYFWANRLGPDSSKVMVSVLAKNGVKVLTGEEVERFEFEQGRTLFKGPTLNNKVATVVTKSGKRFECGVVGVGIGIKVDLEWIAKAGVKTNRGILTNEYLETNVKDVYAAGDCAEFADVIFGRQHMMGNWANATSQGQAAAKGMVGERTIYETASSYSDSFFEGTYSFIGVTDMAFADEVISRGSVESGKMTQIYIKTIGRWPRGASGPEGNTKRIVGATVINSAGEVAPLTAAVKGKVDVSFLVDKLADTNFDLNQLVN
ncbi:MAG: FAD/NAD(P)-binding oxidoreductase [Candidatus Curtissbacteria bacterium]|nr:FAD/NAD(P)-binding oxidoreductase [Candidatus Curtissbacteria bacterium]